MTEGEASSGVGQTPALAGGSTLTVSEVHKAFARGIWPRPRVNRVLRGVSFELAPSTMVGLVGENGSGKSVLMWIIAGSLKPDVGSVSIAGRLGYCPQIPMLYDRLSSDETLRLFGHAYGLEHEPLLAGRQGLRGHLRPARRGQLRGRVAHLQRERADRHRW